MKEYLSGVSTFGQKCKIVYSIVIKEEYFCIIN